MSRKERMNCNCSEENCWSKIPAEALIPVPGKCGEFNVRVVQVSASNIAKPVKLISMEEWQGLCDNCRFTPDGRLWEPYVPKKK
jgi:hypothetical protein